MTIMFWRMAAMELLLELPLVADFSLIQLHLKREAAPMAASQNSTDGPRPITIIYSFEKQTLKSADNVAPYFGPH